MTEPTRHDEEEGQVPKDPQNPASKPQGTTEDQITNMESEGQAQEQTSEEQRSEEQRSEEQSQE